MNNWSDEEIKGKILHKLSRQGKFEHSHTAVEYLQTGFPKDLRGRVKEQVGELMREGILKVKKTNYGTHVSISVDRKEEIMRYIDIFLSKE